MGEKWPTKFSLTNTTSTYLQGSLTCRKAAIWDRRLYFPSEGRLLAPSPTQSWITTPCQLSTAAYSMQLPSIRESRLIHPQRGDDRDPFITVRLKNFFSNLSFPEISPLQCLTVVSRSTFLTSVMSVLR
jgi:hypothetical protein